jgi:hypothetical protein
MNEIGVLSSRGDQVAVGAVVGTGLGLLTGALIGASVHRKFVIQGKKEKFQHMQKKNGILP